MEIKVLGTGCAGCILHLSSLHSPVFLLNKQFLNWVAMSY